MRRHLLKRGLHNRWTLLLALILPLGVLAAQAWFAQQQREHGTAVKLPIDQFDARHLLVGHYLTYKIDYGISDDADCPASDIEAAVCLSPNARVFPWDERPASCSQYIRGNCNSEGDFITQLERFYIPEQYVQRLQQRVENQQGSLLISLDGAGNAAIRDLLIDDQPWKALVKQ